MEKTDTGTKTAQQAQMLANRLRKRARHLGKWAKRASIGAYRLYDRDIPEVPLVLDLYRDAATDVPALCGALLYERPIRKGRRRGSRMARRDAGLGGASSWNRQGKRFRKAKTAATGKRAIRKNLWARRANANKGRLAEISREPFRLPRHRAVPGRRAMRAMVAADSQGKRALNLFCYTASFSAHAAFGAAASTDSVDLSNTYLT